MIKLWAEKELRNLRRISQSSIPCPEPIFVKANVLMMKFIGKDMQAAPRLVFDSIHSLERCHRDFSRRIP